MPTATAMNASVANPITPPARTSPAPMNARAFDLENRHDGPADSDPISGTLMASGLPTRQSALPDAAVCAVSADGDPGTFGSGLVFDDRNALYAPELKVPQGENESPAAFHFATANWALTAGLAQFGLGGA